MLNYFQAIILGLLQGIAEPFPISSLGHSVIFPTLFGWSINQKDPFFLDFLVATHVATALVFLLFFWKEWVKIAKGMCRSFVARKIKDEDSYAKLGWLLVIGSIPAGILGVLFQDKLALIFASAQIAAAFLMLNGILLYGAELLRRKAAKAQSNIDADDRIAKIVTWRQSFYIGAAQALALIPGLSRSGSTMAGGLLVGLSNEDAAHFSFLLATPIIGAAALLRLPDLFATGGTGPLKLALVGGACAAVAAYFSVKFLMKFFASNRLTPFAIYCFLAGAAASIYLWIK
jgi:undecaprenyl-diphosphatase